MKTYSHVRPEAIRTPWKCEEASVTDSRRAKCAEEECQAHAKSEDQGSLCTAEAGGFLGRSVRDTEEDLFHS